MDSLSRGGDLIFGWVCVAVFVYFLVQCAVTHFKKKNKGGQ